MFIKILIIFLLSIILTGCKNNNTTTRNDFSQNDYNRISNTSPSPLFNNDENNNQNNIASGENDFEDNNENESNYIDEIKSEIYGSKEDLNLLNNNALASFTTPILTSDPNRFHNIKIVSDRLNGYVLKNNETFSFNTVCGPYGKDDGFKEATILLSNGKEDKGYGGGVCQLSTTLYNAVKDIGVEITERHHHSIPVAYVEKDQDATVSLQSDLDFKFKNVSGKNLKFETSTTENSVTVFVH